MTDKRTNGVPPAPETLFLLGCRLLGILQSLLHARHASCNCPCSAQTTLLRLSQRVLRPMPLPVFSGCSPSTVPLPLFVPQPWILAFPLEVCLTGNSGRLLLQGESFCGQTQHLDLLQRTVPFDSVSSATLRPLTNPFRNARSCT